MEQLHLIVHGLVQGVGFRYFISHHARLLGLTGFIQNLSDGSVEIIAEGDHAALLQLASLAQTGPAGAEVSSVKREHHKAEGLWNDFEIQ